MLRTFVKEFVSTWCSLKTQPANQFSL